MILELNHELELYFVSLLICYPRMLAFLSSAMMFSQSSMTRTGRHGLVLVLCFPLVPVIHAELGTAFPPTGEFIMLLAKEYVLGFCLGYSVSWVFWSVQAAGALIDNQRGASMAESMDPLLGHQSSPLGNLFSQAITVYLFLSGGFLLLLGILYNSYALWPAFDFIPRISGEFPMIALGILDKGMRLALVYAAPVVVIMFLAEFALAMVSRFAPQIQVFILAMPIKSGIAIAILIFYVIYLFPEAAKQALQSQQISDQILQTFDQPEAATDTLKDTGR